jgi:hypothetical protein
MTVNVTGFAAYQTFSVGSGTTYIADATGTVLNVPLNTDLRDLINDGGRVIDSTSTPSANGLFVMQFQLISGKNSDGTTLAAAAAAGKFGLTLTAGTSEILLSEAANSNTKTDIVIFEHQLPRNYIAGTNMTLTANAQFTIGGGTSATHTLGAAAYKCANAGTQGATLIATAAATLVAAAADYNYVITGTTLNPLDRILLSLTAVIQDSGASNVTGQINSVRLS